MSKVEITINSHVIYGLYAAAFIVEVWLSGITGRAATISTSYGQFEAELN